ncbi:MAG: tRNA-dihydrouridine synthase [Candidatus Kerfeldbacteria bacterium]|nr:tRNA-dihydrouridine synthase [Candidatus Kerfeldbacteria bacterium]
MATNFWLQLKHPILALAPMEGVTDSAFRLLCRRRGADVVYTEFMAAEAITHGAKSVLAKMRFVAEERPVVCQIFGKSPEAFATAAKTIEDLGFDGIDLNFGCPARKVVSHGAGVALLRDPQYARRLVEAALERITIPLSIKVRTSIRKESKDADPGNPERYTALQLIEAIKGLPVHAIMVHGRGYEQGHSGDIDTDMIRQVKAAFPGIVLANGGITTPAGTADMLDRTGADGVGIARGAWGQPWIFRQSRELLSTGRFIPANPDDVVSAIIEHAKLLNELKGAYGLLEFRKHFGYYVTGFPGAAQWRRQAVTVSTIADVTKLANAIGNQLKEIPPA